MPLPWELRVAPEFNFLWDFILGDNVSPTFSEVTFAQLAPTMRNEPSWVGEVGGAAGDVVHEHPTVLRRSGPAPGTWAELRPQAWGGGTAGKRPLISMIPIPDMDSIKEEFMEETQ